MSSSMSDEQLQYNLDYWKNYYEEQEKKTQEKLKASGQGASYDTDKVESVIKRMNDGDEFYNNAIITGICKDAYALMGA